MKFIAAIFSFSTGQAVSAMRSATVALALLLVLCPLQTNAGKFDEYQVKAAFLYNLTNFINWPEDSFNSEDSPFIITILGRNVFRDNLERVITNEMINNHPIIIRQIKDIEELKQSHLLFITSRFKHQIDEILPRTEKSGLLTVADFPGFCKAGGDVNLLINSKRVNLEINMDKAQPNNLKISSKLLRLAELVETAEE